LRPALKLNRNNLKYKARNDMYEARGVIHLHSTYSDGSADVPQIISAAQKNGLDFVILTDHDNLRALHAGWEDYHSGVMLICGYEITPENNHYLVVGTDRLVPDDGGPGEYVPKVRALSALGFIAHPDHVGAPYFGVGCFNWTHWEVEGFTGLGIWDLMTDWQERMTGFWQGIKGVVNPLGHIRGPRAITLSRFDKLNLSRRVVGIGEVDNHGARIGFAFLHLTIFPYRFALGTVRNHLLLTEPLTGDFAGDKKTILEVLGQGRLYVSMDAFAPADGFRFWGELPSGNIIDMGDRAKFDSPIAFQVQPPADVPGKEIQMRLLCNGNPVAEHSGEPFVYRAESPGVYRVEAYLLKKRGRRTLPWIFSNPITLTDDRPIR
jgi:hypothetical protein